MTEQFTCSLELFAKLATRRKLHAVTRRRQRFRSAAEFISACSETGNDDATCGKPGDRSNPLCHVRSRKKPSQHMLQFAPRLAACFTQELIRIFGCHVTRQHEQPRQVNPPAAQLVERRRHYQRQARHAHPLQRPVLGVTQALPTISKQRRTGLPKIKPPPINLHQVRDHLRARHSLCANQRRHPREQLPIRKSGHRLHVYRLPCEFSPSHAPPSAAFEPPNDFKIVRLRPVRPRPNPSDRSPNLSASWPIARPRAQTLSTKFVCRVQFSSAFPFALLGAHSPALRAVCVESS